MRLWLFMHFIWLLVVVVRSRGGLCLDITGFFIFFVEMLGRGFFEFFDILSSIEFMGTNLFDFIVTIFILHMVLSIFFVVVNKSRRVGED